MILPPDNLDINLPTNTPPAVAKLNAIIPSSNILAKLIAWLSSDNIAVAPTASPKKIVIAYNNVFAAASTKLGTQPDSLIKLPNISIPIKAAQEGIRIITTTITTIGNKIFSRLETFLVSTILI